MENEETRTTSEIVVALEEKINTIMKIISVYDMNSKLTLDRVNKIYAYIEKIQAEDASEMQTNTPPQTVKISQDRVIPVSETPTDRGRVSRTETFVPPPQTEQAPKPKSSDRKIPIMQRVVDDNNKDIFLVDVTIMNDMGEQVGKAKTNATGKWQAHLKPGSYSIHMAKTDTASKKKFEMVQEINIPDADTTVMLPQVTMRR